MCMCRLMQVEHLNAASFSHQHLEAYGHQPDDDRHQGTWKGNMPGHFWWVWLHVHAVTRHKECQGMWLRFFQIRAEMHRSSVQAQWAIAAQKKLDVWRASIQSLHVESKTLCREVSKAHAAVTPSRVVIKIGWQAMQPKNDYEVCICRGDLDSRLECQCIIDNTVVWNTSGARIQWESHKMHGAIWLYTIHSVLHMPTSRDCMHESEATVEQSYAGTWRKLLRSYVGMDPPLRLLQNMAFICCRLKGGISKPGHGAMHRFWDVQKSKV